MRSPHSDLFKSRCFSLHVALEVIASKNDQRTYSSRFKYGMNQGGGGFAGGIFIGQ